MIKFINILQFLTRITIKKDIPYEKNMGSGLIFFPVVGMIIGSILSVEYILFSSFLSKEHLNIIAPFVIVFTEALITGGLHIDGFGDTFDGLFSNQSREDILRIMKDPRLGTNGLLAVVFLILGKVILIYLLIDSNAIWTIFLMPMLGRYVCVVLSYKSIPAKHSGMGNMFIGKCDIGTLLASTALSALVVTIVSAIFSRDILQVFLSVASVGGLFVFSNLMEYYVYKKIGGLTGDILGCGIELSEFVFLIYILLII